MLKNIWDWVKSKHLTELSIATILLSIIYLVAWFLNGYLGMHFSCSDLITFYSVIVLKNLGSHTVDSVFNSQKGEPPQK
jgi:hypothetical protein